MVNAIAHRDYSISGTQIDVDIYSDRIEIVSPGSWLLPKDYNAYPAGSIPSIRRNAIIAACLDVANLMERGGTGFQTMIESYKACPDEIQPVVSIYPGFLNLKLFDRLYRDEVIELDLEGLTDGEKVLAILKMEGPKPIKELQMSLNYRSRSQFLNEVINPLMKSGRYIGMVSQNHQQHLLKSKDKISFTVRDYKADIRKDAAEKLKALEKAMTKGRA